MFSRWNPSVLRIGKAVISGLVGNLIPSPCKYLFRLQPLLWLFMEIRYGSQVGMNLLADLWLHGLFFSTHTCQSASKVLASISIFFFVLTGEDSLANYTPLYFLSKYTGRFIRGLETALQAPLAASARTFAIQFNFLSSFNSAPSPHRHPVNEKRWFINHFYQKVEKYGIFSSHVSCTFIMSFHTPTAFKEEWGHLCSAL